MFTGVASDEGIDPCVEMCSMDIRGAGERVGRGADPGPPTYGDPARTLSHSSTWLTQCVRILKQPRRIAETLSGVPRLPVR